MNNLSFYDLEALVNSYYPQGLEQLRKAYNLANYLHKGQKRASGEDYIIHPLNVAYILAMLHADIDTICAALLHDTIEDTEITKEELEIMFNYNVANLVDGVSKISRMNFSSKEEQRLANTRKIILGLTNDVRIILIKLADRLHNMRTLQYKTKEKQIENAIETLEIFVPLAYYLGIYEIKNELENISLFYLYPDEYQKIKEDREEIKYLYQDNLEYMKEDISKGLQEKHINNDIRIRIKSIYGIYKAKEKQNSPQKDFKISDINDLFSLKINVDNIDDCYRALRVLHFKYYPVNPKFKDYICRPKTNKYQSLHTTIYGFDNHLVQAQIRTFEMDKLASLGITEYWQQKGQNAIEIMQEELKKYQFYDSLIEIDKCFGDDLEFVKHIKNELFYNKVYTYSAVNGKTIELPVGSTPIDFAYKVGLGDNMVAAIVNGNNVDLDYTLKKGDIVEIVTNNLNVTASPSWIEKAKTTRAKIRIRRAN